MVRTKGAMKGAKGLSRREQQIVDALELWHEGNSTVPHAGNVASIAGGSIGSVMQQILVLRQRGIIKPAQGDGGIRLAVMPRPREPKPAVAVATKTGDRVPIIWGKLKTDDETLEERAEREIAALEEQAADFEARASTARHEASKRRRMLDAMREAS